MLSDKARIFVAAGAGGNGCMSFRREAHVPKGGPDGGDGGHGGDVVLLCDDSLRDLQSFRRRARYEAGRGRHGEGSQRHGADGEPLIVRVPPGTEVTAESGATHDLVRPGQRAVVATGGAGGRGNKRFAGSTRQAPRFAEKGLPGTEDWLELRLKLLADVGLIGLPNAGKSSLISRLTRAAPKVADYPFTTLEPVLGTLDGEDRQLVLADIPGLIEGAAEGHGLGHDFLAHVERTRLLVHVLDLAPVDGSDPVDNHRTIEHELAAYDPRLATLPRILVLSKSDLVSAADADAARLDWERRLDGDARPREDWEPQPERTAVIVTSSATGAGLDELRVAILRAVPPLDPEAVGASGAGELAEHHVFRPGAQARAERQVTVDRDEEGVWVVHSAAADRLIARHDLENEDALTHVEHRLRKLGVIRALDEAGFQHGDDVEIGGVLFDLDPD
ncbi:MAG: GTPase ObgE [Baekduia sp.]